ncbi:MAG: ABC transporter permease, partial [Hydrogenophaga sp.]|nr:ABC transporter permease [Hydrogenophaga sp.]
MWLNTLLLALRSIRRNLMRSFLTILGIVIGVSAVITMVTLGNGATMAIQNQISGLGTNLLQVRPGQRMGPGGSGASAPAFKDTDADAIASQIGGIVAVAPEARTGSTVVANGRNWTSSIIGSTNEWLITGNWKLSEGRNFSDDELRAGSAVCIIGETVRRELYGQRTALGDQLRVKQISCEVIGILTSKGQGAFGNDQDDMVLVPIKTLQRRLTGNTRVNTLLVSMADGSDANRVKAGITQLLRERRKLADTDEDNFNVLDTKQLAETLSGTTKVLTTLLGAVAAVSLLVGGIGIMNIMLVSVTERTREIGIRLAIGALGHEVLLQFLIEAVVLAALGGLIGIVFATAASIGITAVMGVPYVFDPG